jgi:hypothetical protein
MMTNNVYRQLSNKEFATSIVMNDGCYIPATKSIKLFQLFHQHISAIVKIYRHEDNDIWVSFYPQETLLQLFRANKDMNVNIACYSEMPHPFPGPRYNIDMVNSGLIELFVARGCFSKWFFPCRKIMSRNVFAPFYDSYMAHHDDACRIYDYKLNILHRALECLPKSEIVNHYQRIDIEFNEHRLYINPLGWNAHNALFPIETKYIARFYKIYPAILFSYRTFCVWVSDIIHVPQHNIPISIGELQDIFEFSSAPDYQRWISTKLELYVMRLTKNSEHGLESNITFLKDLSALIYNKYPRYLHIIIYPVHNKFTRLLIFGSFMPTFNDDDGDKIGKLILFIINNIERCPQLHNFINTCIIDSKTAHRILQNYPMRDNPIAKYMDEFAECISPRTNNSGEIGPISPPYFDLLNTCKYEMHFRIAPTNVISAKTLKFRKILTECCAQNPRLIPNLMFMDDKLRDELYDGIGAIYRIKIKYIYMMTYVPLDIRHIIAHSFIHKNAIGDEHFARYLRITSESFHK